MPPLPCLEQWRRRELLVQRALSKNLRHLLAPEALGKVPFVDIFELLGFIFCFQVSPGFLCSTMPSPRALCFWVPVFHHA